VRRCKFRLTCTSLSKAPPLHCDVVVSRWNISLYADMNVDVYGPFGSSPLEGLKVCGISLATEDVGKAHASMSMASVYGHVGQVHASMSMASVYGHVGQAYASMGMASVYGQTIEKQMQVCIICTYA
jgi:hypothetical protein